MTAAAPRLLVRGPLGGTARLRVGIASVDTWTAAAVLLLERAVAAFVGVGAHGGFAVETAGHALSRMALAASSRRPSGLVFDLNCERIDTRAFQVLRNVVHGLGARGVPSAEIRVAAAAAADDDAWREVPPPDEGTADESYPLGPLVPPFEVAYESDGSTRARRCVVEHVDAVPPADALRIAAWVEPWFSVVEMGGFAAPDYLPGEVGSARSGVAQFDDHSTEIALLRYAGSEALWPVLENLVADYHARARPVRRLVVE
jgi:hypothetical protein